MKKLIPHLSERHTELLQAFGKVRQLHSQLEEEYSIIEEDLRNFFDIKWSEKFGDLENLTEFYVNSSYFEEWEPRIIITYIKDSARSERNTWIGEDPGVTVESVLEFAMNFQEATGIMTVFEAMMERQAADVIAAAAVYDTQDLELLYPNYEKDFLIEGSVQFKGRSGSDIFFIFKNEGLFTVIYHNDYEMQLVKPQQVKELDNFFTYIERDSDNSEARFFLQEFILNNWSHFKANSVPKKIKTK